jgi:hypothetical protein
MDFLDRVAGGALSPIDREPMRKWVRPLCQGQVLSVAVRLGGREVELQVAPDDYAPRQLLMVGAATFPDAAFPLDLVVPVDESRTLERRGILRENLVLASPASTGALPELMFEASLSSLDYRKNEVQVTAPAAEWRPRDGHASGARGSEGGAPPPPPPRPECTPDNPDYPYCEPHSGAAGARPPSLPPPPPPPPDCTPDNPDYPYC